MHLAYKRKKHRVYGLFKKANRLTPPAAGIDEATPQGPKRQPAPAWQSDLGSYCRAGAGPFSVRGVARKAQLPPKSTPSPTLFLTKIDSKEFCTSRTAKPGPEVGRCSALRCRAEQKLSSTGTGISLQKTSAEARPAKANSPAE